MKKFNKCKYSFIIFNFLEIGELCGLNDDIIEEEKEDEIDFEEN